MKKLIACVVLILTLVLTSASAQRAEFWPQEHLVGLVHTVQIEFANIYFPIGKEDKSKRRLHQKIVYDRRGNEIERTNFKADGSIENRFVQILDANGRVIASEDYEPEADGKNLLLVVRTQTKYDERGNRIEVREGLEDAVGLMTWSYDAAGHVIEEARVADGGAFKEIHKHTYDAAGRLLRTTVDHNGSTELIEQSYDPSGHLLSYKYSSSYGRNDSETRYVYDALGREVECSAEDAISTYKRLTSYDSNGRVSQQVTYFSYKQPNISSSHAPKPGTVKFRYNDNGQVVEEAVYAPGGALERKTVMGYDDQGRIISSSVFDVKYPTSKTTFEYDQWDNCVKIVATNRDEFNKPYLYVTYRVITYYEGK